MMAIGNFFQSRTNVSRLYGEEGKTRELGFYGVIFVFGCGVKSKPRSRSSNSSSRWNPTPIQGQSGKTIKLVQSKVKGRNKEFKELGFYGVIHDLQITKVFD